MNKYSLAIIGYVILREKVRVQSQIKQQPEAPQQLGLNDLTNKNLNCYG